MNNDAKFLLGLDPLGLVTAAEALPQRRKGNVAVVGNNGAKICTFSEFKKNVPSTQ